MATCYQCWRSIEPDAEWPDNGLHRDGWDFHDGCYDLYLSEDAKAFRAKLEALPVRVGRENANGGTRVTGRPVICNCNEDGVAPCPRHGAWAK